MRYSDTGDVDLSVTGLASPLLHNHATVKMGTQSGTEAIHISESVDKDKTADSPYIYRSGSDIAIKKFSILRRTDIPDTDVYLEVSHPGIIIEQRVIWLFSGAIGLVGLTYTSCMYAYRRVLKPIYIWTSRSQHITMHSPRAFSLPFADRTDEIGTLAKSVNALLVESHRRVEREQAENDYRAELLSLREKNFQIIGHEIRSPLQALSALIKPDDDARRYIDRILNALPYLEQAYTIDDTIENRKANLKSLDIVAFVEEIISNAPFIGIEFFDFTTSTKSGICKVDPEGLEDVLENLIRNANRHRKRGTPIFVRTETSASTLLIHVENKGDLIPQENLTRLFDFGFSTTKEEEGRVAGIGLSISRHNIVKMRGTLSVQNVLPDSVRFTVALPLTTN
jgi:signal transduction histidine kinase